jgi:hypothetical protein
MSVSQIKAAKIKKFTRQWAINSFILRCKQVGSSVLLTTAPHHLIREWRRMGNKEREREKERAKKKVVNILLFSHTPLLTFSISMSSSMNQTCGERMMLLPLPLIEIYNLLIFSFTLVCFE